MTYGRECFLWAREELLVLFTVLVLMSIGGVHDNKTVAVSELAPSLRAALHGSLAIEHWSGWSVLYMNVTLHCK